MSLETAIKLFKQKQVHSIWDVEEEKWYFSIVDIISVLMDSTDANAYWRKLEQSLKEEGNETATNYYWLKGKLQKRRKVVPVTMILNGYILYPLWH